MTAFLLFTSFASAGAFNDWTGEVDLPGNTRAVVLDSVEGAVTVTVDPTAKAPTLHATDHRPGRACQLQVAKDSRGRTEVSYGPKDQESARACRADFALVLPGEMSATVKVGLGDVRAVGLGDALTVRVGRGDVALVDQAGFANVSVQDGDVELERVSGTLVVDVARGRVFGDPTGPVRAKVGEGRIQLRDLRDQIEADTAIGDILLAFGVAPAGPLNLNAGDGHVVVDLPDDTLVHPTMSSMTGTATCELPSSRDAAVEVVAVAGMGSIRLH